MPPANIHLPGIHSAVKRMIGWNTLLYHRKCRRRGPNQSPRVLCRAGGPHHLVVPVQVVDMETMPLLLAQTDTKMAVTLDRLRLPYFTNVHYNEQRNTPSCLEPLSCFTMNQFGVRASSSTSMSKVNEVVVDPAGHPPVCR